MSLRVLFIDIKHANVTINIPKKQRALGVVNDVNKPLEFDWLCYRLFIW